MIPWMQAHLYTTLLVAWVAMNAINTMPTPHDGSSAFYEWIFKFLQAIGGAIPRLLAIYSPATLNQLTGQTAKTTVPPNPPIAQGEAKIVP
jgi:hypothetical protein